MDRMGQLQKNRERVETGNDRVNCRTSISERVRTESTSEQTIEKELEHDLI